MNSDEQGYNGWTNYETWLVKLWIDNDQGTQEYWLDAAEHSSARQLADELEAMHVSGATDAFPRSCVLLDLLNAALSEVNWREIAESLLEDVQDLRPETV